jgi:hypothetical protein
MRRATVVKLWASGVAAGLLIAYLAWFVPMAVRAEHAAARAAAAARLDCPLDRVELGPSHQVNDGPSEYDARGCGKTTHIECEETVHGFPEEYLRTEPRCRVRDGK